MAIEDFVTAPARAHNRWLAPAIVGLLLVSILATGAFMMLQSSSSVRTVKGSISTDFGPTGQARAACIDEIGPDSQVQLRDETGVWIAEGGLGSGIQQPAGGGGYKCVFALEVWEVPNAETYELEIDGKTVATISKGDLANHHWRVSADY